MVFSASCASTNGPAPGDLPKPKIALVLGGGAARGFAHVGVIRALEQEKVPIDLIVGTSVGSLIGAIYAHDLNSFELEWTAFSLEKEHIFDFAVLSALTGMGPVKGDRIEEFVRAKIPVANIENLKLPFAAVATDLNRGTRVVLDRGSVAKAVHASSSIPGVFNPVEYQGRYLVDGGVIDNIPISVAREKGADIVIAVDISENVANFNIANLFDVMIQSVNIMFAENVAYKKRDADILIAPAVGNVAMLDFTQKKRCMQAGIEATQRAMPEIRKKIEEWGRKIEAESK
ncbi:MAG: patatin [Nitrospirae bacterium GWD2_57_9]|nr:MAG: patatin [Nitrospirae bacterium GWD2_57_9]OGW45169.1 MAG: patatin [Nitrospirae bacterium GWC2_57_9]